MRRTGVGSGPADRLREALQNESPSLRLQSALAAGTRPDPTFVEVLVRRSAIEPDFFVREMLTWALMRHPAALTVARLVFEVGDDQPQAQSQALHTLSKIGDARGWAAITPELLRDPNDGVARSAWRTAAGLVPPGGEGDLAEQLCTQLGRGTRETQASLARALAMLGEAALAPLEARRADAGATAAVRVHAAAAAALVRDPDANVGEVFDEARGADGTPRADAAPSAGAERHGEAGEAGPAVPPQHPEP